MTEIIYGQMRKSKSSSRACETGEELPFGCVDFLVKQNKAKYITYMYFFSAFAKATIYICYLS